MPFFAASTGIFFARAAWITALAVALITAVTPPDCAYRSFPLLIIFNLLLLFIDLIAPGR